MAQPITNQDLNNPNQQNQNPNQVQTNQSSQNQQQNAQNQGNNQIAQNYSGSNTSRQASGAPPTPAANPNKQQDSGYTNIQRIVQANQGNKLGSTIGSNIQNAAQQAQQGVTQAQQQFQQQAGANRSDTGANQQLVQQALANPTQISGNQNQVSQFQNLLSGTYQGPKGLANAGQLQAQAQDVNELGQATTSAGGQQGLLQRFVGTPQYTSGQQSLDSLLLGATGGNALNQARRSTAGVQQQANQAAQGATQTAQEYANRNQQFGQNVQNQFGQNVAEQQQGLTKQAQQAQQARDAQVSALQQQVANGTMTQDVADQLGLGLQNISNVGMNGGDFGTQGAHLVGGQGLYTYGVDPSKYIAENSQQANAQNSANAQQYAQMQALAKLGGQFAPNQAQQTLAQFNNPSQAGTFQAAKAYNVDNPAFQGALQQGQQTYQNYLNNVLNPALNSYNQGQQNAEMQRSLAQSTTSFGGAGSTPHWDAYWRMLSPYTNALNQAKAGAAQDLGQQFNIVPNATTNGNS